MITKQKKSDPEDDLIELVGEFYSDLAGYIMAAYQWSEIGGPLSKFSGPEKWVLNLADDISNQVALNAFDGSQPVPCIYVAVASGNGCAKSAFAGMISNWIASTRPLSRITVTANTGGQLRTKTWPEITKWSRLSITKHWWEIGAESIKHNGKGADWAINMLTWSLQNPTAFAGQHAREASSAYIWDESSKIPEGIYEEADGGLTDGEPFWIMLGNPTNRNGRLFRAVFGDLKWSGPADKTPPAGEFISRSIDSRTCEHTNKAKLQKWIDERGEDSDWVRAHIKGEPPNADETQFIDNRRVQEARRRPVLASDGNEALRMSIDFARGGSASNVIGFRRGRDARSIKATRIPGDKTRDTTIMVSIIKKLIDEYKPDVVFGDSTGIGGPIMDRLRQLYPELLIVDVVNGGSPPDAMPKKPSSSGNWRAYCWTKMKEWLVLGCIEDAPDLEVELTSPGFFHNQKDQLMLESKEDMEERGDPSPDWGDQLAMTFGYDHVEKRTVVAMPLNRPGGVIPRHQGNGRGWMRR